jgi:hypothetical protein
LPADAVTQGTASAFLKSSHYGWRQPYLLQKNGKSLILFAAEKAGCSSIAAFAQMVETGNYFPFSNTHELVCWHKGDAADMSPSCVLEKPIRRFHNLTSMKLQRLAKEQKTMFATQLRLPIERFLSFYVHKVLERKVCPDDPLGFIGVFKRIVSGTYTCQRVHFDSQIRVPLDWYKHLLVSVIDEDDSYKFGKTMLDHLGLSRMANQWGDNHHQPVFSVPVNPTTHEVPCPSVIEQAEFIKLAATYYKNDYKVLFGLGYRTDFFFECQRGSMMITAYEDNDNAGLSTSIYNS